MEMEKCPKCGGEHVKEITLLRGADYHYECKDCKKTWRKPRLMSKEDLARFKSGLRPPSDFMIRGT